MKHGDISNNPAPVFAVRLEDFLLRFEQENLLDKIKYFGDRKYLNPHFDDKVLKFLDVIFRKTNYSVYLVHSIILNSKIRKLLENIPFSNFMYIENDNNLIYYLNTGFFSYYVDNYNKVNELNIKNAVTLEEAYHLLIKS